MARLDPTTELWLRRLGRSRDSGVRLVCFPHAGGSANYFLPLAAAFHDSVEALGVQYPGRQDRRGEQLIDDMAELADQVGEVLCGLDDRPLALFGHSMGAVLAFEVTRRLTDLSRTPLALLVSGRRAPSIHRDDGMHRKSDSTLVAEIEKLSGTDASLLADEEIRRMVLPAIRADYKATETYRYRPGARIECAISAFVGERDPRVTVPEAEAWSEHAAAGFRCRVLPGGHFYLLDQRRALAGAITEDLVAAQAADASRA